MKILVTGAGGFVGRNLVENLKNIRDGKDRTRTVPIDEIMEYDLGNTEEQLKEYCRRADFVFHLAGINRPKNPEEFMEGNCGFSSVLLKTLLDLDNRCPIMLSSSIQASLAGRFENSEYGKSKLGQGSRVPVSEPVRKMVPAELQQRRGDILPQHRKQSSDHRQ